MKSDDFFKDIERWLENAELEEMPIPKELHSVYLDGPFETCIGCEQSLLFPPRFYEIQKVFKGKEVIFEYALCSQCGENLMREYSRESLEALQNHFNELYWPSTSLDYCHLCQSPYKDEYSLMSLCKGSSMLGIFVLCEKCMEEMESLLSEKTRRTMEDFIESKFPGIPAEFNPIPAITI